MSYSKGALFGEIIVGGHGSGTNNTQLNTPIGLYFDSLSNSLIISNPVAHNVVRWPLGSTHWTLLAGSPNGTSGNTSSLLSYPIGMVYDPMGNMYVVDRGNHRTQLYMVGETIARTIAGVTAIPGNSSNLFNLPWWIALDAQLNLYVSDSNNYRIQSSFVTEKLVEMFTS